MAKRSTAMVAAATQVFGDNWPKRRKWMVRTLVWAMINVQAILVNTFVQGSENALLENALIAFLALIASIIATYVFGATWDDKDKRQRLTEALPPEALVPNPKGDDIPPEGYVP